MALAKNTQVQQIVTPINGIVTGFNVDNETGQVLVKVDYTDTEGNASSRYFKESELEAV